MVASRTFCLDKTANTPVKDVVSLMAKALKPEYDALGEEWTFQVIYLPNGIEEA